MKKTFPHCDINDNVIQNILRHYNDYNPPKEDKTSLMNSKAYRAQQIKLGYSLLIIDNSSSRIILEKILLRLSNIKSLEDFEEKFLHYLWRTAGELFIINYVFFFNTFAAKPFFQNPFWYYQCSF